MIGSFKRVQIKAVYRTFWAVFIQALLSTNGRHPHNLTEFPMLLVLMYLFTVDIHRRQHNKNINTLYNSGSKIEVYIAGYLLNCSYCARFHTFKCGT